MKPISKPFVYRNAEESRSPGYLRKRMAAYRQQVAQESAKPRADVIDITPGAFLLKSRGGK